MGPAPLPPHERAWRHPSELAPTFADVDLRSASTPRSLLVATGAAAALLAVVLVVGLNPTRSTAPLAISATTMPSLVIEPRNASVQVSGSAVRDPAVARSNNLTTNQALALTGAPTAVSSAPLIGGAQMETATEVPAGTDHVLLLTTSHVYRLVWNDVERLTAVPDGSVVVTTQGGLLGVFVDSAFRILAG